MGGGRIVRDKLWFYLTYRETGASSTVPGMWFNRNAGNPNSWTVDFDQEPAGVHRPEEPDRDRPHHLAGDAPQQDQSLLVGAVQHREPRRGRQRDADAGGDRPEPLSPVAHSAGHVVLAVHEPAAVRGGLGHVPGAVSQQRAAHRWHPPRRDGSSRRAGRRDPEPGLTADLGHGRRLPASPDREHREPARLDVVCHRRAQHEVRLPGRLPEPEPDVHLQPRSIRRALRAMA